MAHNTTFFISLLISFSSGEWNVLTARIQHNWFIRIIIFSLFMPDFKDSKKYKQKISFHCSIFFFTFTFYFAWTACANVNYFFWFLAQNDKHKRSKIMKDQWMKKKENKIHLIYNGIMRKWNEKITMQCAQQQFEMGILAMANSVLNMHILNEMKFIKKILLCVLKYYEQRP